MEPVALAMPPTAIAEISFTVSSCPSGQAIGAEDSASGRVFSKVEPHARQRYSYRGTGSGYTEWCAHGVVRLRGSYLA